MMRGVRALALLWACPTAAVHVSFDDEASMSAASDAFAEYVVAFGRDYEPGSEEYDMRKGIFARRLEEIRSQNSIPDRLWKAEVNKLSDRTDAELAMLRGWRHVDRPASLMDFSTRQSRAEPYSMPMTTLKKKVDWRSLKVASPVPDQKDCGSCWAVATIAMFNGRREIATGEGKYFATQQLVNCVPNPRECGGQGGCNGATVELGLQYIEKMGVQEEDAVPYKAANGTCESPLSKEQEAFFHEAGDFHSTQQVKDKGGQSMGMVSWYTLPENKAQPLLEALQSGPVAISVAAKGWTNYQNGIFDGCKKDAIIDHAVTAFGYGTQRRKGKTAVNFWTVRNSWGDSWGEKGFVRILRSAKPEEDDAWCGIDNEPGLGVACKPYPKEVTVCGMCGILYDSVVVNFAGKGGKSGGKTQVAEENQKQADSNCESDEVQLAKLAES